MAAVVVTSGAIVEAAATKFLFNVIALPAIETTRVSLSIPVPETVSPTAIPVADTTLSTG